MAKSKVLIVEDDEFIIRLYTKTLEHEGYEVQSADNGLSALELLPHFQPEVVLLDIMMPTMNGIDFLKKVKGGSQGGLPVIVLTNVSDSDVTLEAAEAGANLVLIKSQAEPDDVVEAVKSVINKESLQVEELEGADKPKE